MARRRIRKHKETVERLQVGVPAALATHVEKLAEGFEWSQARMASALLEATVEDRQRFFEWLVWRLGIGVRDAFTGKAARQWEGETVYIQTQVPSEVAEKVKEVAEVMNHTTAKAGGVLIEHAVHDHEWIIGSVQALQQRKLAAKVATAK